MGYIHYSQGSIRTESIEEFHRPTDSQLKVTLNSQRVVVLREFESIDNAIAAYLKLIENLNTVDQEIEDL